MTLTFFRRFRLQYDLSRELFEVPPLPAGYSLWPWSKDLPEGSGLTSAADWTEYLIEMHARAKYASFRQELDVSVFPCLGDLIGCRQLMKEIVTRNGFVPAATWLLMFRTQPAGRAPPTASPQWEPVGTIQGIAAEGQIGTIQNIGVAPSHRHQGLGRLLISRALAGFRAAGLSRAVLEVTAHNTHACALYQRLGFEFQRVVYKYQDVDTLAHW